MDSAIREFVHAGVLKEGIVPERCYRLFPVYKSPNEARLVYDLSSMTGHMPRRRCMLPSMNKALRAVAEEGRVWGIKIDLRDGFYHIPLAPNSQKNFGVLYNGRIMSFARLPMGLCTASAEMQWFACCTVKVVEATFPGVWGMAYIDDFLFLAREPELLRGVSEFLHESGYVINFQKSIVVPTQKMNYLGLEIDLQDVSMRPRSGVVRLVRHALYNCSVSWPFLWRQRLAGYVNFLRECLRLPLQLIMAILDGDSFACRSILPFISEQEAFSYEQYRAWHCLHGKSIYVDATPLQIGIVDEEEMFIVPLPRELPIYLAEYLAAILGALLAGTRRVTIFSDNVGVVWNFNVRVNG